MGNKRKERECLDKVLAYAKKSRGETKKILSKLAAGNIVENERPDFIIETADEIIGVEHFQVDALVEKRRKDGKLNYTGAQIRKEERGFSEKWKDAKNADEETLIGISKDLCQIVADSFGKMIDAGYQDFLTSISVALEGHCKKANGYRKKIDKNSKGKKVRIAFLIETYVNFRNLYLYQGESGKIKRSRSGDMLFFKEVVDLCEKASGEVDYLIFWATETLPDTNTSVVAISTKDVRKSLSRQNIKIYEYLSEDAIIAPFDKQNAQTEVKPKFVSREGGNINFVFDFSQRQMHLECQMAISWIAFCRALQAKSEKRNFACDLNLLKYVEVLSKYVIGWRQSKKIGGIVYQEPILRRLPNDIVQAELKEFMQKYQGEENDET